MPINIEIEDGKLEGFNEHAQEKLKASIESYSNSLISESNRLEAGFNSASGVPEITSSIVSEANSYLTNRFSSKSRSSWGRKLTKIAATVFALITGLVYESDSMQEPTTLIAFVIVLSLTIILTTINVLKED